MRVGVPFNAVSFIKTCPPSKVVPSKDVSAYRGASSSDKLTRKGEELNPAFAYVGFIITAWC